MLPSKRFLPFAVLAFLAACQGPTDPTARAKKANKTECVTTDLFEDCDRGTLMPPTITGGWQLLTVNGHTVTPYSMAQAYSFRAKSSDPFNTRYIATYGFACVAASGAYSIYRQVGALVDTAAPSPYLPAESPYSGVQNARGLSSYLGNATWQFGDTLAEVRNDWQRYETMTVTLNGDRLDVVFPLEGYATYEFVSAGSIGVQDCAGAGY